MLNPFVYAQHAAYAWWGPAAGLAGLLAGVLGWFWSIRQRREHRHHIDQLRTEIQSTQRNNLELLRTFAHELHTPLNGIIGFAQLIQDSHNPDEQREFALGLKTSSQRLSRVTRDMLDFITLSSGSRTPRPQTCDPVQLTRDAAAPLVRRAEAQHVELELDIDHAVPKHMLTDRAMVHRALTILLDNALKFTDTGSIDVRVDAVPAGIRWTVRDTGIGISRANHATIANVLASPGHAEINPGRGLGLALFATCVHTCAGQTGFHSQVGEGSEFWFELPLTLPQPDRAAIASQPIQRSGQSIASVDERVFVDQHGWSDANDVAVAAALADQQPLRSTPLE